MNVAKEIILAMEKKHFLILAKRFAGHSKWANIKHTKSEKDTARSQLFAKLAQRIKITIQDKGDANPVTNSSLAQAIESAKKQSMPIASIQNAIKIAQVNKTKCEEYLFEIKGPKGCFIIASAITDNRKKTKDTLSSILRRNNATFADNVAKRLFIRKAIIEAEPPEGVDGMDKVMEHAIESGSEDVAGTESKSYLFYCDPGNLEKIRKNLEDLNYKIIEAENHYIPNSQINLSDSDLEAMGKLCDKLEEHPDVIKLYDNIA